MHPIQEAQLFLNSWFLDSYLNGRCGLHEQVFSVCSECAQLRNFSLFTSAVPQVNIPLEA